MSEQTYERCPDCQRIRALVATIHDVATRTTMHVCKMCFEDAIGSPEAAYNGLGQ